MKSLGFNLKARVVKGASERFFRQNCYRILWLNYSSLGLDEGHIIF